MGSSLSSSPQVQPTIDKNVIPPTTSTTVPDVDIIYYTNLIKQLNSRVIELNGLLGAANSDLKLAKDTNVSISEQLVTASSNIGQVNATNLIKSLNQKIIELNNQITLVSGQYSKPIRMLLSQLGVQYGEVILTGIPTVLNDPNIRQNIVGAIIRILGKIRFGFYDDKMLVTLTAETTQHILSQSDDTFLNFLGNVIS